MTRDEEFNHIPELGPARDALDQTAIPTLNQASGKATVQLSTGSATAPQPSNGRFFNWLLLLLMLVMGGAGYWGAEHINQLQKQLIDSNQRLAALEGLISATDENANKSGAALQAQIKQFMLSGEKRLKHVDSELAKLWAVAYQRNKPKIAEIDQTLATLDKQSEDLGKQSVELDAQLKQAQVGLEKAGTELKKLAQQQASLQRILKDLESSLQLRLTDLGSRLQLRDQANQELDSIQDSQMLQLEKQLKTIRDNPAIPTALALSVKEHEQAIAAINSFRKQVNTELLRLGGQIELLQRSTAAATNSTKTAQ